LGAHARCCHATDAAGALSTSHPEPVQPYAVALVAVIGDGDAPGLLLIESDPAGRPAALPYARVEVGDASWQDALVRAVREQAELTVTFDRHVQTESGRDGQMLIFGQTRPIQQDQVRCAGKRLRVIGPAQAKDVLTCEVSVEVVTHWFAAHAASAAEDRRFGTTGRRALDAELLARTDLAAAVQAVHHLRTQNDDFETDQYASTLLDQTLRVLVADQRARWGERAKDLLLTFCWHLPRDQMPVDELFDHATEWSRAHAISCDSGCFAQPELDRVRAWMDDVALAHALGRVMAPVHAADPVGLVRSILGFGPFGRLNARLAGDAGRILAELGEAQWEQAYAALGAGRPAVLRPGALDPDALAERFADVLARQHLLATR
jgi:hypothetical protein